MSNADAKATVAKPTTYFEEDRGELVKVLVIRIQPTAVHRQNILAYKPQPCMNKGNAWGWIG